MIEALKPIILLMSVCAIMAASPDSFTREELEALVAERDAAERKLQALQQAGDEALSDLSNIDTQLLAAAMESQRREDQASSAEKSLIDLGTRRVAAQMALLEDRQSMEDLLAALAASNRRQPPALVISPGKANTAVRRAILMSVTMPQLTSRADDLTEEIDELNRLERRIRGEKVRLEAAEATLAVKQVEIERLAAAKRGQFEDLSSDIARLQAQAAALGSQAETLEGLLSALERSAPTAPGVKPSIRPRLVAESPSRRPTASPTVSATPSGTPLGRAALGGLKQPASGRLLYAFGDSLPAGGKTEWLTYATRAEAQVIAPVAGTVEYARPFRTYGAMLILRTSDGYHVILTGMSKIYVAEGQAVLSGEPVGRMPNRADPKPELNMELRFGDKVMNPANWMPKG